MNPFLSPTPTPGPGWGPTFLATFAGLGMETLPFLLIGTFLAALISTFVPPGRIKSFFPRSPWLAIPCGAVLGFFLPICECATIPLARRLRDEGVPESTALAFLLAAPIVYPLTLASTVVAYRGTGAPMAALRLGIGLAVALTAAALLEAGTRRGSRDPVAKALGSSGLGAASAIRRSTAMPEWASPSDWKDRLFAAGRLCSQDFLDSSRYLVGGILVAALIKSLAGEGLAGAMAASPLAAMAAGGIGAFLLSLCSSADAFVARSFFGTASLLGPLVFLSLGPLLDLKNTLLLSRFLPGGRLGRLALLVVLLVMGYSLLATGLAGGRP